MGKLADVTGDGKVNILDVLALIRAGRAYGMDTTIGEAAQQALEEWIAMGGTV